MNHNPMTHEVFKAEAEQLRRDVTALIAESERLRRACRQTTEQMHRQQKELCQALDGLSPATTRTTTTRSGGWEATPAAGRQTPHGHPGEIDGVSTGAVESHSGPAVPLRTAGW
jgi:hypothetical protein